MAVGLLVDTTRCQGCRGCQVACKQWNLLPGWGETSEEYDTSFSATMTNPPDRDAYTYNTVEFHEVEEGGKLTWNFVHRRCFHCHYPACVSVCPVGALHKLDNGPVVWEDDRCIGCRYCQTACPFDVPKFQWDQAWPKIQKCHLCWNRIKDGIEPICAKTCPPSAIEFGGAGDLLRIAKKRIKDNSDKYYNHIYGEFEAGGTCIIYLTAVAPEKIGFNTDVETEQYPPMTWEFLSKIPYEIEAIALLLAGTYYFRKWRVERIAASSGSAEKGGK